MTDYYIVDAETYDTIAARVMEGLRKKLSEIETQLAQELAELEGQQKRIP